MEIGREVKGRYIIKEKIGTGGMADVFLVTDKISKGDFAMKMMKSDMKVGAGNERFRAEANVLAKINSKNVVKIHDAFLEDDEGSTRKFIVMEFVDGITLQNYMKKAGIIGNKDSIKLVGQILNALREMHSKKIYHRDIKPQNILVSHEGIIKVIDFGIVKTPDSEQLTKTNNVVGSVQYIAPEILAGEAESACSDIYSTGIIFYTMLTGIIPFNGTDIKKILYKKLNNSPDPIRHFNEKVDAKLAMIVMKSISRETEYRYQTSEEMLKDIKRYLEGKSLQKTTQLRTKHLSQKEQDSLDDKKLKKSLQEKRYTTSRIKKLKRKLTSNSTVLYASITGLLIIVTGLIVGLIIGL